MIDYRVELKLSELERNLGDIKKGVESITDKVISGNELWDNSDIIRQWHVSERTLADWRKKKLITYSQIGKKIYYDRNDRETFIKAHKVLNINSIRNE